MLGVTSPAYLAASNVIPSDDSDFGAPRWAVAWIVVVCFGVVRSWMLGSGKGPRPLAVAGRFWRLSCRRRSRCTRSATD